MLLPQRIAEFRQLFGEFGQAYLSQPRGRAHLQNYEAGRIQGRQNFEEIREESRSGVPTDMVLQRLLPHTDTAAHRNAGSWIHIAPAIQGDVKTWFEAAGWRRPDDWPNTARAIYSFLLRCMESPSELELACHAFANSPSTTGLQTGMLTPMLNALRPDEFLIINNKSRSVVNYLTGRSFKQRLTDYHALNTAAQSLIAELQDDIHQAKQNSARPSDLFDMFCHWLVAEKKYAPISNRAGRIHGPQGEVTVTVPDDEDGTDSPDDHAGDTQSRESHRIQSALAEIGTKMGFKIWIPRSDRAKVLQNCPNLRGILLDTLPLNYIDVTLKTIEHIDVIWIRRHSIARAFEVEHTTAIYSGLLRMADLLSLQPDINIRLHIVAPDERQDKVIGEITRPVFTSLEAPLPRRCSFIPYSSVLELQNLPQLEFMNDSVLNAYEVFAEVD